MRWIRRLLVAVAALGMLVLLAAGLGLWRLHVLLTTSPVREPATPLLDRREPPPAAVAATPAWEQRARADQVAAFDLPTFANPPREYGPWTRWWWPGNVVERDELEREVALLADAGFGGVEIQPFGVNVSAADRADPRWRERGWDTPAFYENVRAVLTAARERGLGVDLNNGSGWPTGGPHVGLEDGMRSLVHSEQCVDGPRAIDAPAPRPDVPLGYYMGGLLALAMGDPNAVFLADHARLVAAVAGRVTRDGRTRSLLDLEDQVALDPASLEALALPESGERVAWQAPEGRWCVVYLWELPGGELVSADAIPDAAYVVDHLDAERVRANQDYLLGSRTGLAPFFGAPLRAYFDDSLEFKQERHFARGQLAEFARRRGYDPTPWLPALTEPGADQMWFHVANLAAKPEYDLGENGARFAEDWAAVTSDLFIERFLGSSRAWAHERGLAHRAQAYGAGVDILRAAGAADIPEAEQLFSGGSALFLEAVSSGAHLYDRPLVSAESFVFGNRAFMSTPAKLKALADYALGSGINQIIFHGTAYQVPEPEKRGYPSEGWYPWLLGMFSEDWSERSPYWKYAAELNRYIARVQYALRLGKPETDVLVLYPGLGFPQGYTDPREPFDQGRFLGEPELTGIRDLSALFTFGGARSALRPESERMRALSEKLRALEAKGIHWEWVNEHALASARVENGVLLIGAQRARSLLISGVDAVSAASAEQLAALAEQGIPVRVEGAPPARARGLADAERSDARVRAAFERIAQRAPSELEGALAFSNAAVRTIRRRLANGDLLVFVHSTREQPQHFALTTAEPAAQAVWLDPWDGSARLAQRAPDGGFAVELPAFGSRLLLLQRPESPRIPAPEAGEVRVVSERELHEWKLAIEGSARAGAAPRALFDWRDDPAWASIAAPSVYTASFVLDSVTSGRRFVLDLGRVAGAVEVRVNGASAGHALVFPFALDVTALLRAGDNTIEVTLIPPRKNAIAAKIEAGDDAYAAARAVGAVHRVAAGLLGPVVLRELEPAAPASQTVTP